MHLRIGTRSSQLALWQAHFIADALKAAGCTTELITYETKGDKQLATSIAKIGSKGVFTEELENDLLEGVTDIAVHSAKDLQSTLPAGLEIIAFTEREKPHDVVLSLDKDLDLNKPGLIVGSSSTRRRAFLAKYYSNIKPVEARGNLQTRLQKLKDRHFDAMLLAYAGVHRMGFEDYVVHHLPADQFVPPTGQASIAVEAATSLAPELKAVIRKACNHPETEACLIAERAYLQTLDGGCSIPVFAHAHIKSGAGLELKAGIISLNGQRHLEQIAHSQSTELNDLVSLGQTVGKQILASGGLDILKQIRSEL